MSTAVKEQVEARFSTDQWLQVIDTIAAVFRLTTDELSRLYMAKVPRLIASIPFVAGCAQAMQTAVGHVGLYVMACRCSAFNHSPDHAADPYARFMLGMTFDGGDKDIIRSGMGRLGLSSYADHLNDIDADLFKGKYNPIAEGEWNEFTRARFEADAYCAIVPEFDEIIPPGYSVNTPWEF